MACVQFLEVSHESRRNSLYHGIGVVVILFALAITASVQLVGVYLVFASLIIPALAVRLLRTFSLFSAYLRGTASYAAGLVLSALLDLPSGAVIIWVLALFALASTLLVTRCTGTSTGLREQR